MIVVNVSPLPSEFLLPNSPEPKESDWARYLKTVKQGSRLTVVATLIDARHYIRAEFARVTGSIAVFQEVTTGRIRKKPDGPGVPVTGVPVSRYVKEIAISCDDIEYVEIESLPDELEEKDEVRKLDLG